MKIFTPAIQVMNRLKYPQKFFLVGILLLIPTFVLMWQYLSSINYDIAFSQGESYGLQYNEPLIALLQDSQRHGLYTYLVTAGRAEFEDELDESSQRIEAHFQNLAGVEARLENILRVTGEAEVLRTEWDNLQSSVPSLDPDAVLSAYEAYWERVLLLITTVGNNSNLILDPEIDTYYLMDTVITKLPRTTHYLARIRNLTARSLVVEQSAFDSRARIGVIAELAEETLMLNSIGYGYAYEYNPALQARLSPIVDPIFSRTRSYLDGVDLSGSGSVELSAYLSRMDDMISGHFALYGTAANELATRLVERISSYEAQRNTVITIAVAAVLASVYFFTGFYFSVLRTIANLRHASEIMVSGNREEAVVLENRDELAEVVTAFNNVAAEMVAARDHALQASRLKDEFLATMSHELRTPLNSIIGYTGILMSGMRGQVDETAKGVLGRVRESSQNLLNLINDILDIAKIEAGRMEIVETAFDVREWIDQLETQAEVLARQKSLKLNVNIADDVPETVYGDPEKMGQVVRNLLSNAVKFTDQGSVSLRVSRKQNQLLIEVVDTGIGIPPQALDYIFDEFRQLDGSTRRVYGGTGLGLAIVRKLCLIMGGRITVQSKVGVGSTFTVNLPLHTLSSQAQSTAILRRVEHAS